MLFIDIYTIVARMLFAHSVQLFYIILHFISLYIQCLKFSRTLPVNDYCAYPFLFYTHVFTYCLVVASSTS